MSAIGRDPSYRFQCTISPAIGSPACGRDKTHQLPTISSTVRASMIIACTIPELTRSPLAIPNRRPASGDLINSGIVQAMIIEALTVLLMVGSWWVLSRPQAGEPIAGDVAH